MLTNERKWSASGVSVILVMATMTPAALAKSAGKKSVEEAITKMEMESAKADMAGQNGSWMKAHNTGDYTMGTSWGSWEDNAELQKQAEKVQAIVAEGVAREGLQEMVLPAEEAAAKRLADFVSDAAIDRMIADAQDAGISLLDGPGGLIGQLTARVIERALGAEMDDHLGYVKGDPAG